MKKSMFDKNCSKHTLFIYTFSALIAASLPPNVPVVHMPGVLIVVKNIKLDVALFTELPCKELKFILFHCNLLLFLINWYGELDKYIHEHFITSESHSEYYNSL